MFQSRLQILHGNLLYCSRGLVMMPSLKTKETFSRLPGTDECRELLGRILASQTFSRSERLSSFLSYIADQAIEGRTSEINEQRIGEAVFGRRSGYDSTADGIVRTQATRLRQRLELYFSTEGARETLRVSVPRGGYVPLFEPYVPGPMAAPAPASTGPPAADPPAQPLTSDSPAAPRVKPWMAALIIAAASVIAGVAVLVHWRSRPSAEARAATAAHPLWSQMFRRDQPTLVIPGDSSLVIWEALRGRDVGLATYLSGQYREVPPGDSDPYHNVAARLSNLRYTSIVDLEIAQALSRMAGMDGGTLQVRYARDLRPNDLKSGNAVLVGNNDANPWVSLFEQDMNFIFFSDIPKHIFTVLNRHPQGNEPHQWEFDVPDPQHHVYAVVAYVSNLGGNGNILILEGTSMAGTECAWDFVSDQSQLLPFVQRIRRPDGTIPHFEVVLGSNNMDGSAVRAAILAQRVDR